MPRLDSQIAMHHLNINPDARLVKQQQRRFRPEIMEAIKSKVRKLIDSGFVRKEQHLDWVANIIPVLKKNGKIRICIDFRELNVACPNNELFTDVKIDNTCGFEECPSWTASQDIIKSRCIHRMRGIHPSEHH